MLSLPETLGLPSFDSTIGAVFLGLVVGIMLYGLTVYQAYKYYTVYPHDRIGLKVFVASACANEAPQITVILAFETFHSALWIVVSYHYLITEAFNVIGLLDAHWSVRVGAEILFLAKFLTDCLVFPTKLTVLTTGFTVFISQTFYAHRVYNGHIHVHGPIAGTWLSIARTNSIRNRCWSQSWLVSVAYGFAVASDIILTGALVFVLQRSRTGSKRSNTILDILIKYTINTGLLTRPAFSASLSSYSWVSFRVPGLIQQAYRNPYAQAIILPGNLVYAGVSIVGAKLYANSVLAVVNSRKSIGNKFFDDFTTQAVPAQSRRDIEESMVWNVRQPTITGMTESISTSQGVSFVASGDTVTEKPAEPDEKRRPNFTMTV
ncbi:uncharacterized protein TRAVEDRAFT_24458 [Trametes versicolor FP-101664 SS1]|uniref:uncharacterized protein n=1 Tax=Trametes versicolor (strain FP-101664) TaxID=717944 RepID=UPI00046238A3|nr:uncharacterized protein TRAVEDRAFT_24458 [Trametes versicolor FP-101664 SS1]EIW52150.1 hypothetical protein TRAVEDRAFT_24458 [Trametes versicolor FP-101664 SS1]